MIEFTFHRTSGTAIVHVGHCIHCIVINACYVDVLLPDFVRHACIMGRGSPLFKTRVQPRIFLLRVLQTAFQSKGSRSQEIQRYYIMTNKIQEWKTNARVDMLLGPTYLCSQARQCGHHVGKTRYRGGPSEVNQRR